MLGRFLPLPFLLFLFVSVHGEEQRAGDFASHCQLRLSEARVLKGDVAGWFFPTREIRHLSLGRFWEKPWEEVARNRSNPIPSMVEFHQLLDGKGVKLVIVPVPAKASIYPDKFAGGFEPGDAPALTPFIKRLRKESLNVIDLEEIFL